MTIDTRDFGTVTVADDDIVTFVQPVFGFEGLKKYIFLFNQVDCSEFVWLQSVEDKDVCFVLSDPRILTIDYAPTLPQQVEADLGKGDKMVWLVTVIAEDFLKSTVNLKSPIVLNASSGKAVQIILEQSYPVRHPIVTE